MEKINISNYYNEKSEVRVECNDGNYKDMYESINEVFNFNTLKSFIDLGCATGHLLKNIKKNLHPSKFRSTVNDRSVTLG